jgi:hypothetical protein
MSFSRAPFFALGSFALILASGCSSGVETTSGTTSGGTTTTTGAGGAGGSEPGSTASSGGTGGDTFDGGAPLATLESDIGPIKAASGFEDTECITVSLKNAEGAYVRRFRADLGTGSHHMIAYRSSAASESLTPKPCQGFSGILNGEHPIFIAQQAKSDLEFPTDENGVPVALKIDANQMVRLELHLINTGASPLDVTGKLFVDTVPLSTKVVESDLAFWGTKQINIPANGAYDTGVKFQKGLANTKLFALTTHQHHLGTRMRVWYADNATDTSGTPVADGQNWSDPPLDLFTPALDFPDSGNGKTSTKGLAYKCEWKNTTATTVHFGESFNDEMCFLWQYYYPSQGFQYCVDGYCKSVK